MTAATQAGALSRAEVNWLAIDWQAAHRVVRRLQARIVKATQVVKPRLFTEALSEA